MVILPILLAAISCTKENPKGDIEGVVCYASTNIPVVDVNVEVAGLTAVSSEDGSYRIDGVETGKKTLNARRDGFIPYAAEIDVQEGVITVPVPMFSPVFTTSVHGIITGDFTGNPQPGLTVIMLNPDGSESGITGTTDQNGTYLLQNVPLGERILVVKSSSTLVTQQVISLWTPDYLLDISVYEPMVFTDGRDGRSYNARKIGDQIWMEENLAYLPLVHPPDWGTDTAKLYYVYGYQGTDPNAARASPDFSVYGVLYNWKAAMSACPDGWHLPDDDEWKVLETYLGMDPINASEVRWRATGDVGVKLKASSGWDSDGNGSNLSGFSALPGGSRGDGGGFDGKGIRCNFWTSSLNVNDLPWNRFLSYDNDGVSRYGLKKSLGFSVRCIKDK